MRTTITFPDKEAENIGHGRRPSDEEIVAYLTARIGVSAGGAGLSSSSARAHAAGRDGL